MLVVDIVAVAALLVALVTGVVRGLFASLGTILGIVAGAVLAIWLVPLLTPAVSSVVPVGPWRSAALAVLAIGTVLAVTAVGAAIGAALRRGVDRTPLKRIERIAGGVVAVVVTAMALLTIGAGVTTAGIPVVSSAVASSQVLRTLDRLTPPALDDALAQARSIVTTDTLPRLGNVIGVVVSPNGPPIALDDPALQRASASVARISGTAYSCGVSMTGSGFVAGDDIVVTNAHVIAGVDAPLVEFPGAPAREGRLVYIDPVDDLAVIAVPGLEVAPLKISEPAVAGTRAAVQGYPLGGPFRNRPADIVSVATVPISDIYEESVQPRAVYALDADVRPGNSGGPLLDDRGSVIGVVFARGVEGEHRGYAMTSDELRPVLDSVSAADPAVESGRCTG
jgi:S1-C subfamily serine protease